MAGDRGVTQNNSEPARLGGARPPVCGDPRACSERKGTGGGAEEAEEGRQGGRGGRCQGASPV
jgi:hypothetical protein